MISQEVLNLLKNKETKKIVPEELIDIQKPTIDVNSMVTMISTKAKEVNELLDRVENLKQYLSRKLKEPVVIYEDVITIQNMIISLLETIKNQCFDIAALSIKTTNIFQENFSVTIKELTEIRAKAKEEIDQLKKEKEQLETRIEALENLIVEDISIPLDPKQLLCILVHAQMEKEGIKIEKPTDLSKKMSEIGVKYDTLKHAGHLNRIYFEEGLKRGWIVKEENGYHLVHHMRKLAEAILELQKD